MQSHVVSKSTAVLTSEAVHDHSWSSKQPVTVPLLLQLEVRKSRYARRLCQWRSGDETCVRFAQGSTKLCIRHSGGRLCETPGCTKAAQGVTNKCIACGGGNRCCFPGCEASARGSGGRDFCSRHGGGPRCKFKFTLDPSASCPRGAQRPSDFCTKHAKQVVCAAPACTETVVGGKASFCKSHSSR